MGLHLALTAGEGCTIHAEMPAVGSRSECVRAAMDSVKEALEQLPQAVQRQGG